MAITFKKFSQNQLTAAAVTQYTVPASTTAKNPELIITNTDTVERTVTVHFVPSGGSVLAANKVLDALPVSSKATLVIPLEATLGAGDFISALASAATAVNLYISGAEIT